MRVTEKQQANSVVGVVVQDFETRENAREALHGAIREAHSQGRRPVVLCETTARATMERRHLALSGAGFGTEVTTLPLWVADLMCLYGDGRALVSPVQRSAFMAKLLEAQQGTQVLPATPGMVDFLCRAARVAFTLRTRPAAVLGQEQALVALLEAYAGELAQHHLVEYTEALAMLGANPAMARYAVTPFDCLEGTFSAAEEGFLLNIHATTFAPSSRPQASEQRSAELQALCNTLFQRGEDTPAVPARGSLVCALAAGPSAEYRMVLDCIDDALARDPRARILVAARDPHAIFDFCAPLLHERGLSCACLSTRAFGDTDAGRAILGLTQLVFNAAANPADPAPGTYKQVSADLAYNPFLGIRFADAFTLDRINRANRLLPADEVLSGLACNIDPGMQGLVGLFEEGDYAGALDLLESWARKRFVQRPAYLAEQLQALEQARDAFATVAQAGASVPLVLQTLAAATHTQREAVGQPDTQATHEPKVPAPQVAAQTQAQVQFVALSDASNLEPESVDCTIIAQLDVDSYSLAAHDDALVTLLQKWGHRPTNHAATALRRALLVTVATARERLYVERILHNEEAEEQPASALFEELMDCYRATLAGETNDTHDILRIPDALVPFSMQAGESAITLNTRGAPYALTEEAALPPAGTLSGQGTNMLVLPRNYNGHFFPGVDLSASQIESYLECPYQWFAKRRLHVEGLDEGFGSLERGTFMHNVLQAFYQRFSVEVGPKVTHDNLSRAQSMLSVTFDAQCHYDAQRSYHESRYVPVNAWEAQQREFLRKKLIDSLVFEADFLPRFHPQYFEWGYGETEPANYAGCHITGRIDRIDVDDEGHAVVIDYKSSLSSAYRLRSGEEPPEANASATPDASASTAAATPDATPNAAEATPDAAAGQPSNPTPAFALPHKMQSLIYAKVVQDQLNVQLVGALYFNPLNGVVQGAYDARVLGAADFPCATKADLEANAVPGPDKLDFQDLIDTSEQLVAQRVQDLLAGELVPEPLYKNVCQYCPVGICPKRQASRVV